MDQRILGDFRITLIRAGTYYWDGGVLFGVVPRTLWSRFIEPDEQNRIPIGFNCYVIETGTQTILWETGGGNRMDRRSLERMKLPDPPPSLPEILMESGFDPESFDTVINSHLHWDHCGWNTETRDNVVEPCFPNAIYYAQRTEWEYAHTRHPRDGVSYIDDNYDPLVNSGQMQLLGGDGEIVPFVRGDVATGHNRDMMVLRADCGGETFCFLSDLMPTAAHVTPTWVTAFDLYPLDSVNNKLKWLERAAREEWLMGFSHECKLPFGRVVAKDGKYSIIPA